jgi:hypothetical protein
MLNKTKSIENGDFCVLINNTKIAFLQDNTKLYACWYNKKDILRKIELTGYTIEIVEIVDSCEQAYLLIKHRVRGFEQMCKEILCTKDIDLINEVVGEKIKQDNEDNEEFTEPRAILTDPEFLSYSKNVAKAVGAFFAHLHKIEKEEKEIEEEKQKSE